MPTSAANGPHLVVILAGGRGQRLGGNKPLRRLDDESLIEKVIGRLAHQDCDICINAGAAGTELSAALSALGRKVIHDPQSHAGLGPLSGVCTALQFAAERGARKIITAPCDMPALPADFVARLVEADDDGHEVVCYKGERDYPLCALWDVRLLPHLRQALDDARAQGGLAVMKYLGTVRVRHVQAGDERAFFNVNTPEHLAAIRPQREE